MQMHNIDLQQKFVDGQSAESRLRTDRHKVHVRFFRSLPWPVYSLFHNMFSTQSDLVILLSVTTILSFP